VSVRIDISVIVASHERPLRLRWLLNALEEQTLPRSRWEVIVGHDSAGPATNELLSTHPLARSGALRYVDIPPGTGTPGRNRNAAVKLARGELLAFTDDDCRPPQQWLERALEASQRFPGAIVQGRSEPDPDEWRATTAAHFYSQYILDPPGPHAEACNIIYPRTLFSQLDGFDEEMEVGEDTDLMLRARRAGASYVGDQDVLTFHAVHEQTLLDRVRWSWRWRGLPRLLRANPEFRSALHLRLFWKPTHPPLLQAMAGAILARRRRGLALLVLPWVVFTWPNHGTTLRGRLRSISELPGRLVVDASEIIALAWGSLRYRTPFL